jgi:hypothetical protein
MWNPTGNFDRISSLGMLMWLDATMYKEITQRTSSVKGFLDSDYWENMGVLKKKPLNIISSNFYS